MSEQNTFNTTAGDDTIFASFQNDAIDGLDGNDNLDGNTGDDTLKGGNGNDSLDGNFGNDILEGGNGNDTLDGNFNDDTLKGGSGEDSLDGSVGNDILEGGQDSDILNGSLEADIFAYGGDPFEGQDVSAPERQIIDVNQDLIADFDFAEDKYRFNATDFDVNGDVNFAAVDANAEDASIAPGTNVVAVLNSNNADNPNDPFLAGSAANQIAELVSEDGAGFFSYFNSNLQLNRVVYSTNLNDADADLNVISQQTNLIGQDAIDALNEFSASNFEFEDVQLGDDQDTGAEDLNPILGDAENNELIGTEGNDLLFGDLGSDTITGGAGADVFSYAGDPFEGQDVSAPERQIIGEEDFITDFNFDEDTYRFNATNFDLTGDVNFVGLDANAEDALITPGTNVVALLNNDNDSNPDTPFLAGTAASQIAELTSEDGAGFFVYYNSELEVNRLSYSTNLNDADADIKIVSRQTDLTGADAIAALSDFSANNFEFEAI